MENSVIRKSLDQNRDHTIEDRELGKFCVKTRDYTIRSGVLC
jgi:hypothetical protein